MVLPVWVLILLAPIIGSWLGVLIRRWPRGQPVALARSRCDACKHPLGPLELIPLASFALLRGRCRHCHAPIGWFHAGIEIAALTIALAAIAADSASPLAWVDAALGWALLCAAWIDAETFQLPDLITLPLILAGLTDTWFAQPAAIYNHAAATALGYLAFRLLDAAYLKLRHRQGLGEGDAKLLAAAGAWLGLGSLPYVIIGAALTGIAMALLTRRPRADTRIAFGPALALAFFIAQLAGQAAVF